MIATRIRIGLSWLFAAGCLLAICFATQGPAAASDQVAGQWYKGNTHAHTLWSDGDELPELVVDWFKSRGYQFLAISDHDRLMEGEQWKPIGGEKRNAPPASIENAKVRFGEESVVVRGEGANRQVKLRTFAELKAKFDEPGKFLMIENEEIGTRWHEPNEDPKKKAPHQNVHMNAINLKEVIQAVSGTSALETINLNAANVASQAERLQRPILTQLNHPNWSYFDISAEDVAQASGIKFFEVCNGGGAGLYNEGDAIHPSTDKLWDVANTIRIAKMKMAPLFGVAADDSHRYHEFSAQNANPGRAWIVVRAKELAVEAILDAMSRGDFYASTGVVLKDVSYDADNRVVQVAVQPEPDVHYTIEFVGTLDGADTACELIAPAPDAKGKSPGRRYSPEVGKVLASAQGESASYKLTGKELYVRAIVRSDKPATNPISPKMAMQQAWCQPVGWEGR